MATYLNNVAADDSYSDELTLGPAFSANAATITIANNAAYVQYATGKVGDWRWCDEREFFVIPQSFQLNSVIGVRFRNAVAGQIARILCTLYGPADPVFAAGTPFVATLSPTGEIST